MRQVYRLLGLVRRYGPGPVDTACAAGAGPRRRQRHQDRLDAGEGDREHAAAAAPGRRRRRPVRPRPGRVPAGAADPHPRREGGTPVTATIRDAVSPDLRATLRALKLGQMLDTLPERLTLARQQNMSHADFLELVLADEVTRRDAKSAGLRARAAGLDPACGWTPGTSPPPSATTGSCGTSWLSLRFLDGPHGALILGPVGVGKTHLASALGHIAVRRRRTVHMAPRREAVQAAQGRPARQHPRRRDAPPRRDRAAHPRRLRAPAAGRHRDRRLLRALRRTAPRSRHRSSPPTAPPRNGWP